MLPHDVVVEIYSRLHNELARRPLEVVRQVYDPIPINQYSFPVKHERTKFSFIFKIDVLSDEDLLVQNAWKIVFVKRMTGKSRQVHGATTATITTASTTTTPPP